METQHKSKLMRAYLLGLLPEDEATALEEEYFVDRQSFYRLQAEESALIADYLDGRLQGRESEIFESRYLVVPELQRKVEEVRQQRSILGRAVPSTSWVRWSLAATLALVLGLGIWVRYFSQKQSDSAAQIQPTKEKPFSAVGPSQEHSLAQQQEPKNPSVAPVHPLKKKSIASVRHYKNSSVPSGRSLEDYLFANAPPGNQSQPADTAAYAMVETANATSNTTHEPSSPSVLVSQRKKRVAVLDFDYGTVQSYVSSIYGTNQDVGKGITDMLVEKLVREGNYSVIERRALNRILREQNFSDSDRANPAVAARIGKLLGVDAVIMGSVTKFGRDDKSKSIGGLGVGPRAFGIGSVRRNEAKAVCAISARLVDANTGEILAAFTGAGESRRSGTSLIGGAGSNGGGAGGFDTHASNFGQTLLGEAVTQAVTDVGAQLSASGGNVPAHQPQVSGIVAEVNGSTLIIKLSSTGLKVGDKLEIDRIVGRRVGLLPSGTETPVSKNPKTITNRVGEGRVIAIDADSATIQFVGAGQPIVGDVAKMPN